jgi:hypothetical protein
MSSTISCVSVHPLEDEERKRWCGVNEKETTEEKCSAEL